TRRSSDLCGEEGDPAGPRVGITDRPETPGPADEAAGTDLHVEAPAAARLEEAPRGGPLPGGEVVGSHGGQGPPGEDRRGGPDERGEEGQLVGDRRDETGGHRVGPRGPGGRGRRAGEGRQAPALGGAVGGGHAVGVTAEGGVVHGQGGEDVLIEELADRPTGGAGE